MKCKCYHPIPVCPALMGPIPAIDSLVDLIGFNVLVYFSNIETSPVIGELTKNFGL